MRKREVEKLLYHAVAEALGIETEPKKAERKTAAPAVKKPPHDGADHRAAA